MAVSRKEVAELKSRIEEHLSLMPSGDADMVGDLLEELIGLYSKEIADLEQKLEQKLEISQGHITSHTFEGDPEDGCDATYAGTTCGFLYEEHELHDDDVIVAPI